MHRLAEHKINSLLRVIPEYLHFGWNPLDDIAGRAEQKRAEVRSGAAVDMKIQDTCHGAY